MAVTAEEAKRIVVRLREKNVRVFYTLRSPSGFVLPGNSDRCGFFR